MALTGLLQPEFTPRDGEVSPRETESESPEWLKGPTHHPSLLLVQWTAVQAGSKLIHVNSHMSANILKKTSEVGGVS